MSLQKCLHKNSLENLQVKALTGELKGFYRLSLSPSPSLYQSIVHRERKKRQDCEAVLLIFSKTYCLIVKKLNNQR